MGFNSVRLKCKEAKDRPAKGFDPLTSQIVISYTLINRHIKLMYQRQRKRNRVLTILVLLAYCSICFSQNISDTIIYLL